MHTSTPTHNTQIHTPTHKYKHKNENVKRREQIWEKASQTRAVDLDCLYFKFFSNLDTIHLLSDDLSPQW